MKLNVNTWWYDLCTHTIAVCYHKHMFSATLSHWYCYQSMCKSILPRCANFLKLIKILDLIILNDIIRRHLYLLFLKISSYWHNQRCLQLLPRRTVWHFKWKQTRHSTLRLCTLIKIDILENIRLSLSLFAYEIHESCWILDNPLQGNNLT